MIPKQLLHEILEDDYYKRCVRHQEGSCGGRVTFEHCWVYASKQIQEHWAIIPLCERHHGVLSYQDRGDLQKDLNQWYSIHRASEDDFARYPRKAWIQIRAALDAKYGEPS